MENDVNTTEAVTQSGVVEPATTTVPSVTPEVAPEQSVEATEGVPQETSQVAPETLADGTSVQKDVPYTRFSEVNTQANELKAENERLKQFVQMQQAQPQQPQQQTQQSMTLQVMKELGIDEDYATPVEMAKVTDTVISRMQAQSSHQMQMQGFIASKPDYSKVVGHQDPLTGQFVTAPPLARVLESNPMLAQALNGPNAAVVAYELASKDPAYLAAVAAANVPPVVKANETAQAAIDAANTQTSISAVAGTGSLDRGAQISAMSDTEFRQYQEQVAPGIR